MLLNGRRFGRFVTGRNFCQVHVDFGHFCYFSRRRHLAGSIEIEHLVHSRTRGCLLRVREYCLFTGFAEHEVDRTFVFDGLGLVVAAQIKYFGCRGIVVVPEIHIECASPVFALFERQIDGLCCTHRTGARKQRVVAGDLLPHDDDLVPISRISFTNRTLQPTGCVNERVAVTPDKVDFAQLGQQVGTIRFNRQRAVDEVCGLVIETIGHMEISLGNRIRLVEIDRGFAAERVLQRAKLPGAVTGFRGDFDGRRSFFESWRRSFKGLSHFHAHCRFLFDNDNGLIH